MLRIIDKGNGWHVVGEANGGYTMTVFAPDAPDPWTQLALCNQFVKRENARAAA